MTVLASNFSFKRAIYILLHRIMTIGCTIIIVFSFSPIASGEKTREVNISPIFQFGGIETEPNKQLNRPSDFLKKSDHEIIVSDLRDNCIIMLGDDGKLIRRIGNYGQGPGDFNRPGKLELFDDKLIVSDMGNYRIQIVTLTGDFIKVFSFPGSSLLDLGAQMWFSKDGCYYYSTEGINSNNLVLRCSMNGKKLMGYGNIYGEKTSFLNMGIELIKKGKIPDWYKNRVIPVVDSDGSVYCIHRSLPIVKKYSASGERIWEINLDLPEFDKIRSRWIRANKEAPPNGSYSLEYWADADIDDWGNLYLLLRLAERMTVCMIKKDGTIEALYKGVQDNISMISLYAKELWAFGGESQRFYKFLL